MLEFRRFGYEHYAEYAAWFSDPDLNSRLGPLDEAWLTATLEDPNYETWAVFRHDALVSVLEVDIDPNSKLAIIAGIATKPELRCQGVAIESLRWLLAYHHRRGIYAHTAYVASDNVGAQRCLVCLNFTRAQQNSDKQSFLRFTHEGAPAAPR